jgi:hypothetical protein
MSKSKTQKHGIDVTLYFIPLLAFFNRSKEGLRAGSKNERWSCKKALPDIVSKRKLRSNLAEIQFNSLDGGLNTRTQEKKKLN